MTTTIVVDQAYQLGYGQRMEIARKCGGWIRSSGDEHGETAEVVVDGQKYTFRGPGLIDFLYAVKDLHYEQLAAAVDLCEYIEKSEKQPPSVFVRDAIATKARELKAAIRGQA